MSTAPRKPPRRSSGTARTFSLFRTLGSTAVLAGTEKLVRKIKTATGQESNPSADATLSVAAQRLVQGLDDLKGAAMKVGQLLSMDRQGDWLPSGWGDILAKLQNSATPWPWERIEPQLRRVWGSRFTEYIDWIEPTAVSAASMGQVHKGRLKDGTAVAIKVRYPGIEQSMEGDLAQLKKALGLLKFTNSSHKLDEIFQVIEQVFHQEIDFNFERSQLIYYREKLKGEPCYKVPEPIEPLCSEEILTMTWLEGVTLHEYLSQNPDLSEEKRNELGELSLRLLIQETFELQTLQSDPNPGNFLILTDQNPHSENKGEIKLGLLDFGATITLSDEFMSHYTKFWQALLDKNTDEILHYCYLMEFIDKKDSQDIKVSFLKMMHMVAEPFLTPEFSWQNCDILKRVRQESLQFVTRTRLRPPPAEMVFFNRRALGTQILLEQLKCKFGARKLLLQGLEKHQPAS